MSIINKCTLTMPRCKIMCAKTFGYSCSTKLPNDSFRPSIPIFQILNFFVNLEKQAISKKGIRIRLHCDLKITLNIWLAFIFTYRNLILFQVQQVSHRHHDEKRHEQLKSLQFYGGEVLKTISKIKNQFFRTIV